MNKYMLLIGVMLIHVSFGTTFTVDGSNIRASISNRDYNRISFKDGKINQAFFKASEFIIQIDEINGQLFVLPRNKKSAHALSMTVTSTSGLTQQFFLTPKNISAQTLVLRAPSKPVIVQSVGEELNDLMNSLIKDKVKLKNKTKKIKTDKDWELKSIGVVDFENGYKGHVLKLRNVSKEHKKATTDILWRKNTRALSIAEKDLRPRGVTKVYMITEGEF